MKQFRPLAARSPVNDYMIGAFYMPNWRTNALGLSFGGKTWEQLNGYPRMVPMKGRYHHEGQVQLMEEQLAEMIRYGIRWLAFDWYHNETTGNPGQVLLNHALDAYLKCDSRLRAQVKFCINWITHSGFTPASENEWTSVYNYWVNLGYLSHPDYLRIDGRPVIYVFETDTVRQNAAGISQRFLTFGGFDRAITAINPTTNEITISGSDLPNTGTSVSFVVNSGTIPGGLTAGIRYFAIRVSGSVLRLATTQDNALANNAIDILDAGTGTFSIRYGLNWSPIRSHAYIYNLMRAYAQSQGLPNPYLVLGGGYPVPFWRNEYVAATADAAGAYNYHSNYDPATNSIRLPTAYSYAELDSDYRENWLWNFENSVIDYIPTYATGWDNRAWGGGDDPLHVCISTTAQFEAHLRHMKGLMDRYPKKCRGMAVGFAWNELGEGGIIEPSQGYGRGMLKAIRDVFYT